MEDANEQDVVETDDAASAEPKPPRLPPMGTLGGLAPRHTSPFEIETNVSRIAQQIAQGRRATYD